MPESFSTGAGPAPRRWRLLVVVVATVALLSFSMPPASARPLDAGCAATASAGTDRPAGTSPGDAVVDGRPDPTADQTAAWEQATRSRLRSAAPEAAPDRRPVVVPVVWHILQAGDRFIDGRLDRRTVRAAVHQIGRGYLGRESDVAARTPFRFELTKITRTENAEWFTDLRWNSPIEREMKTALRTGGPEILNVYSVRPVAGISGWASFPQEYPDDPIMDGVVIHFGTVPGGFIGGQGDIPTHEVGHWLGLYHTFQGGCTAPGDHVDDTPYEASSARECDVPRDTCEAPGDDPVHNYMDYAKDQCKDQFTIGQRVRMVDHWQAWRAPPR